MPSTPSSPRTPRVHERSLCGVRPSWCDGSSPLVRAREADSLPRHIQRAMQLAFMAHVAPCRTGVQVFPRPAAWGNQAPLRRAMTRPTAAPQVTPACVPPPPGPSTDQRATAVRPMADRAENPVRLCATNHLVHLSGPGGVTAPGVDLGSSGLRPALLLESLEAGVGGWATIVRSAARPVASTTSHALCRIPPRI